MPLMATLTAPIWKHMNFPVEALPTLELSPMWKSKHLPRAVFHTRSSFHCCSSESPLFPSVQVYLATAYKLLQTICQGELRDTQHGTLFRVRLKTWKELTRCVVHSLFAKVCRGFESEPSPSELFCIRYNIKEPQGREVVSQLANFISSPALPVKQYLMLQTRNQCPSPFPCHGNREAEGRTVSGL